MKVSLTLLCLLMSWKLGVFVLFIDEKYERAELQVAHQVILLITVSPLEAIKIRSVLNGQGSVFSCSRLIFYGVIPQHLHIISSSVQILPPPREHLPQRFLLLKSEHIQRGG